MKKIRRPCVNLFQYSDHHTYLSDSLNALRSLNSKLSYQKLMDELQLTSKSQIFRLLKAEPFVLSKELVYRLSAYLGHSPREAEYFHLLVAFGEAESESDRLFFFEQLKKVSRPIPKARFSGTDFEYFSEWYYPVVRELVTHPKVTLDTIGKSIYPPLTEEQVQNAIAVLEHLGMIHKEGTQYVQKQSAIVPDPEFRSLVIRSFQIRHMKIAEEALKYSNIQQQHLGAITFGINKEGEQRIRNKISEFISDVISIASQYENNYDHVMQLNLQLFPVSKVIKEKTDP